MSEVARSIRDHGIFNAWNVRYINTWDGPGHLRQVRVVTRALAQFLWLLISRDVALLHAHSAAHGSFWRKSLFCALARIFQVPYVYQIHSGEFPRFFDEKCGRTAKWWVRHTLNHASCVVVLTESWRNALSAIVPRARIEVIGNPVDIPASTDHSEKHGTRVLFLGRLREKKGVFDLIRAVPLIRARVPNAQFSLAGDGDIDSVRALAESLGVIDAIHLPGWVEGGEKEALLRNADVLVLPSYFEGLPVCVLEAMANGIPVVATKVGGIPDVLEDGLSGILVNAGDIDQLAVAITRVLHDTSLRARLQEAGLARVRERYAAEVVFEALRRCYGTLGVSVAPLPLHNRAR